MIQTSGLIRHLLKSVATALLLWWVLRQVDIESGIRLLADSDFALLAAATVVLALLMVPATLRWRYVLRNLGLDYPYGLLLQWNLAAGFFNNILPTGVGGDVLRAEWSRRSGLKVDTALESVAVDRLTAFFCLLLLVTASLPFVAPMIEGIQLQLTPVFIMAALGVVTFLLCLVVLRRLKFRATQYLYKLIKRTGRGVGSLSTGPGILVSGLATHIIRVLGVWMIARALNIDISFAVCLLLVPVALLLAMIPITVGGWGLRESVFVIVFSQVQITAVEATAWSVVYGLANLVSSLPGAGIWVFLKHQPNKETTK